MQNTNDNIFQTPVKEGEASLLIIDESLETRTASLCELLVGLDTNSIQLGLKEKKNNRFLALESFPLSSGSQETKWQETLEQLSRNSHLLRNFEFTKAIVGVFSEYSTLVPDAIFKQGDERKVLEFNFEKKDQIQKVFSRQVQPLQLHSVFAVSEELHRELFHLFEEPELVHLSSSLLEAAQLDSRSMKEKDIFLNFRNGNLDAIVFNGKKLLLMNSFPCTTVDDFIYFALMICDQLELDPDSIPLRIAGEIEKESAKYKLFSRYFRNLEFSKRPANVNYSYRFDAIPSHHYFSLFSLALCES